MMEPGPGAPQAAVTAMKANVFPMMGATRSYRDFYMEMVLPETLRWWRRPLFSAFAPPVITGLLIASCLALASVKSKRA